MPLVGLRPGERVRTPEGGGTVVSVDEVEGEHPVWNLEVHGTHTYHAGIAGVLVHNAGLCSRIAESKKLLREAKKTRKSLGPEIDSLIKKLEAGHPNPGSGNKPIGKGISEARTVKGARVYFRRTVDDVVEILGISSKHNQESVIAEVLKVFGGGGGNCG